MNKEKLKEEIIRLQNAGVEKGIIKKATNKHNMEYLNKKELINIYNVSYQIIEINEV